MIFDVNKEYHLIWNLDTNELAVIVDDKVVKKFKHGNKILSKLLDDFSVLTIGLETVEPSKPMLRIDISTNSSACLTIKNVLLTTYGCF